MDVSLTITNYSWPDGVGHLADLARQVDASGLHTLWLSDHLLQVDPNAAPDERDMLEAYTVLGFLAAHTERVQLGAMVSPITYRPPAVLLKAAETVDALSGGRGWLGLGAGYPGEASRLDLPMPPTRDRFAELERFLRDAGFGRAPVALSSELAQTVRIWEPRPLGGRLPVMIAGMGEQQTLRLVAEYADACNLFDIPDGGETLLHKLDVLDDHCRRTGRDPSTVTRTVSTRLNPDDDVASFSTRLRNLEALGLEHAVVLTAGPWQPAQIDLLAKVADAVG